MYQNEPLFQKKKVDLKVFQESYRQRQVCVQSLLTGLAELDEALPSIIEEVRESVVYIVGNKSAGSGIILTEDGDILTNAHVVNENQFNKVELWNDEVYEANVLCVDTFSDLALINISVNHLKPAVFANQDDILKGKVVLAIGSPELFRESVTMGIMSGLNRGLDGVYPYRLIQTDAVINHGNSGGPLVNLKGEVVGINTFGLGSQKGVEVLNFAIPIDTVEYVLSHFYQYGVVNRPYLGVLILENNMRSAGNPKGATVLGVLKDSSAEQAGIIEGDIIYEMDGEPVSCNPIDFYEKLKQYIPGQKVKLKIERDGRILPIIIELKPYQSGSVLTKTVCVTKQVV